MPTSFVIRRIPSHVAGCAMTAALVAAAACDPVGPATLQKDTLGAPAFSRTVGIEQFQQQLDSGPARVRIVLEDTGLVARRIRVTRPDQLGRPERIESRITGISAGVLTLALGNLTVSFDDSTRFRADDRDGFDEQEDEPETGDAAGLLRDDGDGEHHTMTAADFVARVQAEIDSGRHPAVEARRAAPSAPQAPDDSHFLASSLRLVDDGDRPRIDLNVTAANLQINGSPPPNGWIQVLGLRIEILTSDSTTRLEANDEDTEGELEFRGLVQSVNTGDSTAVLDDGTVLHLVVGTEMEDADEHEGSAAPQTLADVQAALAAGKSVVAKGEGLLKAASPRTLDVIEIRFRVVTTTGG